MAVLLTEKFAVYHSSSYKQLKIIEYQNEYCNCREQQEMLEENLLEVLEEKTVSY